MLFDKSGAQSLMLFATLGAADALLISSPLQRRHPAFSVRPAVASRQCTMKEVAIPDGDMSGRTFYSDKLCSNDEEEEEELCELPGDDEFTVAILGDLHLDPRKMEDYYTGRDHFIPILEDAKSRGVATALVSLGDLGESKSVRPEETQELFAGTTACHELAAEYLSSFNVPCESHCPCPCALQCEHAS